MFNGLNYKRGYKQGYKDGAEEVSFVDINILSKEIEP